ncbi:uncharacterized protein LOC121383191 [Gigantopelta aegis]|uniref:uncharacterized protein LOC121383191 n=1 Tax=Gigantopelta aegis TaxID=1735272 RepID=UPI001B887433|nr:uncharacterized protein LOC121383191 [Gigantopelta aegis]
MDNNVLDTSVMANEHQQHNVSHVGNIPARPQYERKSKLLFLEKMLNFEDSFNEDSFQGKTCKTKNSLLKKTKKLKLSALNSTFDDPVDSKSDEDLLVSCDKRRKKPVHSTKVKNGLTTQCNRVKNLAYKTKKKVQLPKIVKDVMAIQSNNAEYLSLSCAKIKSEHSHKIQNVVQCNPADEAVVFNEIGETVVPMSSYMEEVQVCSSTDKQVCDDEQTDVSFSTKQLSVNHSCKESSRMIEDEHVQVKMESPTSDGYWPEVKHEECLEDNSTEQIRLCVADNRNHFPDSQSIRDNRYCVTIFAYKCHICQTGFATLHMLQEHNREQCSEIIKNGQRPPETSTNIHCTICPDLKPFENVETYRQHMRFHHVTSTLNDLSNVVCIRCALCKSKEEFTSISSLKRHLGIEHLLDIDFETCSDYIIKESAEVARTKYDLCRTHENKGYNLPSASDKIFYVCRICDEPFSEHGPFLKHYNKHQRQSKAIKNTQSKGWKNLSNLLVDKALSVNELTVAPSNGLLLNGESDWFKSRTDLLISDTAQTKAKGKLLEIEEVESVFSDYRHEEETDCRVTGFEQSKVYNGAEGGISNTPASEPAGVVRIEPNSASHSKLLSTENVMEKVVDASDAENSRVSVTVGGFEIELDQPLDDIYLTPNDHNQNVCSLETSMNEFICKICHKSFSNYVQLLHHNKVHELLPETTKNRSQCQKGLGPARKKIFKYLCPKCDKGCSSAKEYGCHVQTHGKLFYTESDFWLTTADNLVYDLQKHKSLRQNMEHTESKCTKTNKCNRDVKNSKCRICLICSKTFITYSGYNQHMARHGFKKGRSKSTKMRRQNVSLCKRKYVHQIGDKMDYMAADTNTVTGVVKKQITGTTKQQYETDVNSSEISAIEEEYLVVDDNQTELSTVQLPIKEDCTSKDADYFELGHNEKQLCKMTDGNEPEIGVPGVETELIIFNSFSLSSDRFENVDILTRIECEMAMKEEPDQPSEEDVYTRSGLPVDDSYNTEASDIIKDDNSLRENDEQLSPTKGHVDNSYWVSDIVNTSKNENGRVGSIRKIAPEDIPNKLSSGDDICNEAGLKDMRVNGEGSLNLRCDICTKVLPTLTFKRIHMLLHKSSKLNT